MFKSKGLFDNIPCPHLDTCVLPNCLFSHKKAIPSFTAPDSSTSGSKIKSATADDEDEARRKRRRLDQSTSGSDSLLKTVPKTTKLSKDQPSFRKSVSPPLSRRATIHGETTPSRRVASSADPTTPSKRTKTPALVKEVKGEDLNPRMLKTAPASHEIRLRLLKMLHEHLARLNSELATIATAEAQSLVLSDQNLIKMALDIEESSAIGKPSIYSNIVKNKIMLYKRMKLEDWKAERAAEKTLSKASQPEEIKKTPVTAAKKPPPRAAEPPKPIETGLSLEQEYYFLDRFLTPLEGLSEHGYVTSVPTTEDLKKTEQGLEAAQGWEVCDRCKARFQVFPGRRQEDGALTTGGSCTYHWGKPFTQDKDPMDPKAKRQRRYKCCGEKVGDSAGCTTSECHVFKITEVKRMAHVLQFEQTPDTSASGAVQTNKPPICIDGEMGYTVYGLELIRLTATSWPSGDELLDVLVRPVGEILDLNSRWSGVWPEQWSSAVAWDPTLDSKKTYKSSLSSPLPIVSSPDQARRLLYSFIDPNTPIIGHGLENDLNALRLIHPTIIDTVFLYPHPAGLPFRHGLKNLMLQRLGRHIQTANDTAAENGESKVAGGHDSKEDARAAGELVRYRIKIEWERMKMRGWTLNEKGEMDAPKGKGILTMEDLEGGTTVSQVESGTVRQEQNTSEKRKASRISDVVDGEEGEVVDD